MFLGKIVLERGVEVFYKDLERGRKFSTSTSLNAHCGALSNMFGSVFTRIWSGVANLAQAFLRTCTAGMFGSVLTRI